ncbi:DMT family transporter [Sphingomonas montanisoli]|uniref:DMT family transporter n=1 Tax=Sphingomonas montanisoli TaxID=2606412 RepID=A0A5D9C0G1_9SPHN|nr:DMT family transporter [Sphingomonas montanisoli]TZG25139.1 DMT family transporter [Sphingomonas montanisoli]
MDRTSPLRTYAMLVLVTLLWAGNSIVARFIHADIPPFTLALCRWMGACLILLAFGHRRVVADWPAARRHWRSILLLGTIGVALFNAFLYSGLRYTTATNALLIQAAIPALVLLFDLMLFRVRPRLVQIVGVTLAAVGVVLIIIRADPAALMALGFGRGDVLVLCGVVAWALYTALLRKKPPIDAVSFVTLTFAIGAICMLPFAMFEWRTEIVRFTPAVMGGVVYVAIFPSVIAYFLFNRAVAEIGPAAAGQAISLQPLFGAVLAAILLGEALHGFHFVGMVLILAGIVIPLLGARSTP